MAEGDIVYFEGALEEAFVNWQGADILKCAVLRAGSNPLPADIDPVLADYIEATPSSGYPAGGVSLGTWANFISFLSKVTKFDSTVNPLIPADVGGNNDATHFVIYNETQATKPCLCTVDFGGNKDMTLGDLEATWHATDGLATFTLPV